MDIFSTGSLVRIVRSLDVPVPHLLNRYFTETQQSTDQFVYFDIESKTRRIAPFVSPLVAGKVMKENGYVTKVFEPPYVKPKHPVDPNKMFTRVMGEAIQGDLSPQQRRDLKIVELLRVQDEAITQREEVMASEALRTGHVTITGEGYGTVTLDFGRDAALTVTLTSTAWDQVGALPLADIEAWALLIRQKSGGAIANEVTLDPDAYAAFIAKLTDRQLEIFFNAVNPKPNAPTFGPATAEKVQLKGAFGGFSFYLYSDSYTDENDAVQDIMPSGTVILTGPQVEGVRAYAAIRDPRASFAALDRFPKNWIEEDPAMEWLMTQSAPLVFPFRPNASLCATVL